MVLTVVLTHMNYSGACEIFIKSSLGEPTRSIPGPVRDGRINPASQDDGVGEVGEELASLGNGTGHDGRSGGGEYELENSI